MKTKELSKEVRHKVVEKYRSGEGYKKISKSLIIPLSLVKSIIKKWKTIIPSRLYPDQVAHPNSAAVQPGNWFGMSL